MKVQVTYQVHPAQSRIAQDKATKKLILLKQNVNKCFGKSQVCKATYSVTGSENQTVERLWLHVHHVRGMFYNHF